MDAMEWDEFQSFAREKHQELDALALPRTEDGRRRALVMAKTLGGCHVMWYHDGKSTRLLDQVKLLCQRAKDIADGQPDPGRPAIFRLRPARYESVVAREWDRVREFVAPFVYERDAYRCVACGNDTGLSVDHILPVHHPDSSNKPDNLRTLCISCNAKKGNRPTGTPAPIRQGRNR